MRFTARRVAAVLAALALCLTTACGNRQQDAGGESQAPEPAAAVTGRYVETGIATPAEKIYFSTLDKGKDGAVHLYGCSGQTLLRYRLDERSEPPVFQEDTDWKAPVLGEGQEYMSAASDGAGNVFVLYVQDGAGQIAQAEDGALTPLPDLDIPGKWYMDFHVLPDKSFLLADTEGVVQLEPDGSPRGGRESYTLSADIWDGKTAVLQGNYETGEPAAVVFYDAVTGDETGRAPCPEIADFPTKFAVSADNRLYLGGQKGIYRLSESGDSWETLLGMDQSSLSLPDRMLSDAVLTQGGDFITLMSGNTVPGALYRYRLDPALTARPEKTLRIVAMMDLDILHAAIPRFINLHPDVLPQVDIQLDGASGQQMQDVVKTINTELLAGNGADLYVLDYLPLKAFQDKGVLADLSGMLAPHFEAGDLMENIVRCYDRDGKTTAIPLNFQIPLLFGPADLIGEARSLSDLADWAQAHPDKPLFSDNAAENLLRLFYPVAAPAFLSAEGLDDAEFARFLTDITRIAGLYPAPEEGAAYIDALTGLRNGDNYAAAESIRDPSDMLRNGAILEEIGGGGYAALPGGAGDVFLPKAAVGVNANSPLAAAAIDLVEQLVSEEVQSTNLTVGEGLPVNRRALLTVTKGEAFPDGLVFSFGEDSQLSVDHWLDEAAQKDFLAFCERLKTPGTPTSGQSEFKMIMEELDAYLKGDISAGQAAAAARDRVQAMLLE